LISADHAEGLIALPASVQDETLSLLSKDESRSTSIRLAVLHPRYAKEMPVRADVIARRMIEHCLDFFIVGEAPEIVLEDPGRDSVSLNAMFDAEVGERVTAAMFDVEGMSFNVRHGFVAARGGADHRVNFVANRRVVRFVALDQYLVDLEPRIAHGERQCVYAGYVSGQYLDQTVTPERTDFTIARNPDLLSPDALTWSNLVDECVAQVHGYLKPFTEQNRRSRLTFVVIHNRYSWGSALTAHHWMRFPIFTLGRDSLPSIFWRLVSNAG
jgi:hypothetical protein